MNTRPELSPFYMPIEFAFLVKHAIRSGRKLPTCSAFTPGTAPTPKKYMT
jgi:hypothetical protein